MNMQQQAWVLVGFAIERPVTAAAAPGLVAQLSNRLLIQLLYLVWCAYQCIRAVWSPVSLTAPHAVCPC
jgi:hypothetical protein